MSRVRKRFRASGNGKVLRLIVSGMRLEEYEKEILRIRDEELVRFQRLNEFILRGMQ
jgi:hypothetical protein